MRTVLLFPGALGDVVLLAPAVTALARTVRVELSVQRSLRGVVAGLLPAALGPAVDGRAMSSLYRGGPLAASVSAWLRGADVVHAWLGLGTEELAPRLAGAGVKRVRCHAVHRDDGLEHVGLAYAADLGVRGPLAPPRLGVVAAPSPWSVAPERRLVIHPGAGAPPKRWPVERFLALADGWRARGGEVTLLCGPAECDLLPRCRAASHRVAGDVALEEAAALIASAPTYAGNDSGISHVAGALGRRGVVLFGPTRPARWRPRGGDLHPLPFGTTVGDALDIVCRPTAPGLP